MAAILQLTGSWPPADHPVYSRRVWYWTSMLWSIDTCQNKVSAAQYQVTISRAQVESSSWSAVFLKLTADQLVVSYWIAGLSQAKTELRF